MDKYFGCNIVETDVKKIERKKPERRKGRFRSPIIRTVVALVVVGLFLTVHYVSAPWLQPVRSVLHAVFCYDAFGRTAGVSAVF